MIYDKSLFSSVLDVKAVKVPVKEISTLRKTLEPHLVHIKRKPSVVSIDSENKTHKYILVKEHTPEV